MYKTGRKFKLTLRPGRKCLEQMRTYIRADASTIEQAGHDCWGLNRRQAQRMLSGAGTLTPERINQFAAHFKLDDEQRRELHRARVKELGYDI